MKTADTQVDQLLTLLQARLIAIAETEGAAACVQEYVKVHLAVAELAEGLVPYFDAAGITIEDYTELLAKEMASWGTASEIGEQFDAVALAVQRVQDEEAGYVG